VSVLPSRDRKGAEKGTKTNENRILDVAYIIGERVRHPP
jgi:hypothetical protein